MNPEQLKEMNEIKWWHQIDLNGVETPGIDFSQLKLNKIQMPKDLTGKTVLDIGAWDGFFSFEAEKRGGDVTACDTVMWHADHPGNVLSALNADSGVTQNGWDTGKKGFEFAKKMLNSKVKDIEVEVENLSEETVGQFDVVLCLGILYHMENPLKICRNLFDVTKDGGMMIMETHCDDIEDTKPGMVFYHGDTTLNADKSNWWGPNIKCVQEMLKAAGFKKVDLISLNNQRGIFHAFKM